MQGIRSVVSCASCRQRKLRCDRTEPCSNCVSRKVSCVYATGSQRRSAVQRRGASDHLDTRLIRLEQLVGMIADQRKNPDADSADDSSKGSQGNPSQGTSGLHSSNSPIAGDLPGVTPGRMVTNNSNQTVYVSAVHWAAICNEIALVRENLEQDGFHESPNPPESAKPSGPMLLQGVGPMPDLEDVLADIPSRGICDNLVARFFLVGEPSTAMFHAPSFQQQYNHFWLDPSDVSLPWLALLFSILSIGAFLYLRSQDDLPSGFGHPAQVMQTFHKRSTECLIMSNYSTSPSTFTIEALLLNVQNEFIRQPDAQVGIWVLTAAAIRLAMRMGYHRDAQHYPGISPFQAEMRRRVWAMMLQGDMLTSCQLGLPLIIQESHCDTQSPRNLFDEDLDPHATELPQSRPETEATPIIYTIVKNRLASAFRAIFNQVSSTRVATFQEVMALDKRLNLAHQSLPNHLRISNPEDAITVPPRLLMRRYNLELLYQKARCILHRHYMTEAFGNSDYTYSRLVCVEAAMALLRHQARIFEQVQVGGRLFRDKWFISSLERHDFLLASMIICLELDSRSNEQVDHLNLTGSHMPLHYSRDEMIMALQNTRLSWDDACKSSKEAMQASNILGVMLDKYFPKRQHDVPLPQLVDDFFGATISDGRQSLTQGASIPQTIASPIEGGEGLVATLNSPGFVNWDLWDAHMQRPDREMDF